MATTIKVEMQPINVILARLGINKNGDVQKYLTNDINRRITKYMPFRTGVLATKVKYVSSLTTITVDAPYARYQYYGKVMEGPAPKVATDRDLNYDKTKHPEAGPFWDKRMMAAEKEAIIADVQRYIRKVGK